jgi:hypothetical protein
LCFRLFHPPVLSSVTAKYLISSAISTVHRPALVFLQSAPFLNTSILDLCKLHHKPKFVDYVVTWAIAVHKPLIVKEERAKTSAHSYAGIVIAPVVDACGLFLPI